MRNDFKELLDKCDQKDLESLSKMLDGRIPFLMEHKKRKGLVEKSKCDKLARSDLIKLMDKQIRYYGSADIAYYMRCLLKYRLIIEEFPLPFWMKDGGVDALEVVKDVCKKCKVSIKYGSSVEANLERLVVAVVDKELSKKSPDEFSEIFEEMGVDREARDSIAKEYLKKAGKTKIIPILLKVLGPEKTLAIISAIAISMLAPFIGRETAKILLKELGRFFPKIQPYLLPISIAWMVYDLQGPAYRKTIPICLYLGVIALRDGLKE